MAWTTLLGKSFRGNKISKELQIWYKGIEYEKTKIKPTYFELLVAFAYWYFALTNVDYAVIEVGLGGLLDGTNIVNNKNKNDFL